MKTPEEIELAMNICYETKGECISCPYANFAWCEDQLEHDAYAYIKKIKAERDQLLADLGKMVRDVNGCDTCEGYACDFCAHNLRRAEECKGCNLENDHWTWRGVRA